MSEFLRKLFNIYAGEEKQVWLFACLGFLWSLGVTSGLKYADVLFLLHVGAGSLPLVYAIAACLMMGMTVFLLKAFNVVPLHRIFITVLCIESLFYLFAHGLLAFGLTGEWLWFALRVFGSLSLTVTITCFWSFIDQYYSLQDAKRLFSVFTSFVFLGMTTTGLIMQSGWVDFREVSLLIVAILLFSAFWVRKIEKTVKPVYDENLLESPPEQNVSSFKQLIRTILRSKFTLLLMAANFLTFLFLVVTEYSYLSVFDAYFDPGGTTQVEGVEENAALALFLGKCIAAVSLFNIIFGLFFYSRLVRYFGLNNLLLITPLILLVAYSGWSISDTLLFPVIGFFVVEGSVYVIDDNNFTLLLNAVPQKVKYKIRLIIESFFEPTGMLISSLLILFAPIKSVTLGLLMAIAALAVALLLRRRYVKAIYLTLAENAIHFQRTARDWFLLMSSKEQANTERRLFAVLQIGDETAQLFAIEALLGFNNTASLPKLLRAIQELPSSIQPTAWALLRKSTVAQNPVVRSKLFAQPASPSPSEPTYSTAELLTQLTTAHDNDSRTVALKTLCNDPDESLVKEIITNSVHFRPSERRLTEALLSKKGESLIPLLLTLIQNQALHERCRILAGRILGRISLPTLRTHLPQIMKQEIDRAHFYFYHYHAIPKQYPAMNLTLLKDDLLSSFHAVLDFIIQLLTVAGETEDRELLSQSLRSPNPKVRSQVVETIEKSCEPHLFRLLYPLIADLPVEVTLQAYLKAGHPSLDLMQLLERMSHSSIPGDQIVAIALRYQLNLPNWKETLREQLAAREELIHHFAYELLET